LAYGLLQPLLTGIIAQEDSMGFSKKIVQLFLLAFGFIFIMAEVASAADIRSGFGGIDWATSQDQVANCKKIRGHEDIQYCVRSDQIHTLLGKMSPGVLYGFYQDAFLPYS
jgi:hypothetical protein